MRTPTRDELRAHLDEIDSGYLLLAVCLFQLIDDGAKFSLTDSEILIFSEKWCPFCAIPLPAEDWQANYLIDIITNRMIHNVNILEELREHLQRGCKVAMLSGDRLRVYSRHGVTIRTIELNDLPELTAAYVIDEATPYL